MRAKRALVLLIVAYVVIGIARGVSRYGKPSKNDFTGQWAMSDAQFQKLKIKDAIHFGLFWPVTLLNS